MPGQADTPIIRDAATANRRNEALLTGGIRATPADDSTKPEIVGK
jgi:hypothetical protein